MTGFGRATAALDRFELAVQISSVNRKNLEVAVSLPSAWDAIETPIAEKVRPTVTRGTVKVKVEISGRNGASSAIAWDETVIAQTLDQLALVASKRGIAFEPSAELLWQIASAQRKDNDFPTVEVAQPVVLAAVEAALKDFSVMRATEGKALQTDLSERLATIAKRVDDVAAQAPKVPPAYRENLLKRLRDARLELDVNDERVLKEVALFADRCDIAEELTRLRSHLEQFGALLRSDGEIGRKAEFIVQEIGREINTIGSKANDLTISRAVIEMKNELERVREQLANVE